jgi:hypothetical protein
MRSMLHRLGPLVAATLLAACGSSAVPTGGTAERSDSVAMSPSASPSAGSQPPASSPTNAQATTTPRPDASATAAPAMSEGEETLTYYLREDAVVGCRPRRTELPGDATVGIECSPRSELVERVGVYGFGDAEGALGAYLTRLNDAGVAPRSGDCERGAAGDSTWQGIDENAFEPGSSAVLDPQRTSVLDFGWIVRDLPYLPGRIGCFLDANGNANMRVTCETGVYIGILGTTPQIGDLYRWAQQGADAGVSSGEPGICLGASRTVY